MRYEIDGGFHRRIVEVEGRRRDLVPDGQHRKNRLDRAGVIDALKDAAVVAALYGFTQATSGALGSASSTPSFNDAKEQGEGLWKKIKR